MTGGITIDLSQFEPVLKKFSTLGEDLQAGIDAEIEDAARTFAGLAKNAAPGNEGRLRGSINFAPAGAPLSYEVFAQSNYAAYMEFGTKGNFRPIEGVNSIIYQGKGSGTFQQFLAAITKWVGRKGIEKSAAYPIARSILRYGVRPHPFFFAQRALVIPRLMERLNNVINQELNK